jgi:uncharacterized membrane protein HdeD (DUF308 family)
MFRGFIALIFGITAFVLPGITLEFLILLLGAFLIADGVVTVFSLFFGTLERTRHWRLMLLEGLTGILIGVMTFIWPAITALIIIVLVGIWAVVTGILEVAAAISLREFIENEWLLGLSGLISILFGIVLFLYPRIGGVAVIWVIGTYAVLFGVLLIFLGLKIRKFEPPI